MIIKKKSFFSVHRTNSVEAASKKQDVAFYNFSMVKGVCCHDNSNVTSRAEM